MNLDEIDPNLRELYNTIKETQTYIHSEVIMAREIGQYSSQVLSDEVREKFIEQIVKYKQHYVMISMIYLLENCKKKNIPINNVKSFSISKFEIDEINANDKWKYENLLSTFQFLNGKEQDFKDLINFLTFSIIPSLFIMFLEVNSFNSFIDFIISLPPTLQTLFSRSLFVSPFFLKFAHLVFYTNLNPFYEGILASFSPNFGENFYNDLQRKLLASIRSNINLLPSFIPQFLNKFDNANKRELILKQAFFDPLIEHPAMYLVVDSYVFENDIQYPIVSKILKQVLTDEFIHEFDQIIKSNNFFYNAFVNQQAVDQYFPSFKRYQIFSNIDQVIMDESNQAKLKTVQDSPSYLYDFIKEKQLEKYCLFRAIFDDEIEENNEIYVQSQRQKEDGWSYLKELIKKSPPLPSIKDETVNNNDNSNDDKVKSKSSKSLNTSKKDFLNLVDSALVEKYDPTCSIDGISFKMIQNNTRLDKNFKSHFEKMRTKHTEIEDAMNASQAVMSGIKDIFNKTHQIVKLSSDFFISYMTKDIEPTATVISFKANTIIKDPIKTVNDLISYVDAGNLLIKHVIGDIDSGLILARRFYSKFHFNNFLAFRVDLTKYDQLLDNFFSNNFSLVREEMKNKKSLNNKIKVKMLYNMTKFDYYSDNIKMAFESNCDPFSKMNLISVTMEDLFSLFLYDCNEFGEPEKRDITSFIFAYTNPPHLLSNLVFLHEFCNYKEKGGNLTSIAQLCNTYVDRISVLFNYIENFSFNLEDLPRTDYYKELQMQQRQQIQQQQQNPPVEEVPWYKRLKKIFNK